MTFQRSETKADIWTAFSYVMFFSDLLSGMQSWLNITYPLAPSSSDNDFRTVSTLISDCALNSKLYKYHF